MNQSRIRIFLQNLFMNERILPWSTKFHAYVTIADYYYSFIGEDILLSMKSSCRNYKKDYHYIQIKVILKLKITLNQNYFI